MNLESLSLPTLGDPKLWTLTGISFIYIDRCKPYIVAKEAPRL